jgi:hypothetical protein
MSPWQKVRAARRREAYFLYFSFLSVIFLSYFSFLSGFFLPSCLGWANPYPTDSVAATTGFMGFSVCCFCLLSSPYLLLRIGKRPAVFSFLFIAFLFVWFWVCFSLFLVGNWLCFSPGLFRLVFPGPQLGAMACSNHHHSDKLALLPSDTGRPIKTIALRSIGPPPPTNVSGLSSLRTPYRRRPRGVRLKIP